MTQVDSSCHLVEVLQPEAAQCSTARRTDGKKWGEMRISRTETHVEILQITERGREPVWCPRVCVFACCLVSFSMFLSKLLASSSMSDEPKEAQRASVSNMLASWTTETWNKTHQVVYKLQGWWGDIKGDVLISCKKSQKHADNCGLLHISI